MSGQVRPGQAFVIRSLADTMGTSVMPVRDALTRLLAEGAVEVRTNGRQITVPVLSRSAIAELFEVRIQLESMAAGLAAERITAGEIEQLERDVATMDRAMVDRDDALFMETNRSFHFTIYHAARSHCLIPLIEMLWLKCGPLLRVPLQTGSRAEIRVMGGAQEQHLAILAALRDGDSVRTREAIRRDLADTAAWFAAHYDPQSVGDAPALAALLAQP